MNFTRYRNLFGKSLTGQVSDLFLQFLELSFSYGGNAIKFLWECICMMSVLMFYMSTFYYTGPVSLFANALPSEHKLKFSEN